MDSLEPLSRPASFMARLLKVPLEPAPPAGAPGSVRTFRAARNFYRFRLLKWALAQGAAIFGLAVGFTIVGAIPQFPGRFLLDIAEALGAISLAASVPVTYLLVHLDYQLRWYIVTDRSLRIRDGVVSVSEKTMSFANIQNVSIRQGPLQRFFGIADVEVRTAGGGSSDASHGGADEHMHLGYFRGVDNAEAIRDAILAQVRQLRDSGLGDPDPEHAAHVALDGDVRAAALDLLDEARALRAARLATEPRR